MVPTTIDNSVVGTPVVDANEINQNAIIDETAQTLQDVKDQLEGIEEAQDQLVNQMN